jgi:integrase
MELGELSRAIGQAWSTLWPKLRKLEERKRHSRALSLEDQNLILYAAGVLRSQILRSIIPLLLLTGMRSGEAVSLCWHQIDSFERTITVGRAKTFSGTGRTIPINDELADVLTTHRVWFVSHFGGLDPQHHVFPFGSPQPTDPWKAVTDISSG